LGVGGVSLNRGPATSESSLGVRGIDGVEAGVVGNEAGDSVRVSGAREANVGNGGTGGTSSVPVSDLSDDDEPFLPPKARAKLAETDLRKDFFFLSVWSLAGPTETLRLGLGD
jgi:hypothetical protein